MKKFKIFLLIFILMGLGSPAFSARETQPAKNLRPFKFADVKKAPESVITKYSGKEVIWRGTLEELISNDAYFEYSFKLESGDKIRVLSGRGLKFKPGDTLELKGFIMIREGQFSHLVVNEAKMYLPALICYKKANFTRVGEFPLDTCDKVIFGKIYSWIRYYNSGVGPDRARYIANNIVYYSRKHGVDPYLVTAVMSVESAFNIYAISVAGAIGLGQLMPGTAASLGVNPHDPTENIAGSVIYLKRQMQRWQRSSAPVAFALASYNAGPGAVEKYGGIPPYRETIDYVNIVSALYYKIRK